MRIINMAGCNTKQRTDCEELAQGFRSFSAPNAVRYIDTSDIGEGMITYSRLTKTGVDPVCPGAS
jgi:hypothetical protein